MPSQGVLNRERVGRQILAVLRFHAQEVGERLQTILAEVLEEGETFPDLEFLQILFARLLESRLQGLVTADEAHQAEKDDDLPPRAHREAACAALREQIVDLRELVRGIFGADLEQEVLGLEGATAESPLRLQRQAKRLLETLRKPGAMRLPAPRLEDTELDLSWAPGALQEKLDDLERALETVDLERRQAETTQHHRKEALDAFDEIVSGVADTLRGWFRLAGRPEIAGRIRLTPPRRRAARRGKGA